MKHEFNMYVGPMFGGKTTKLLSAIDRYKYQGRDIHVFKPDVDSRYSTDEIVTHWGARIPARRLAAADVSKVLLPFSFLGRLSVPAVIAVDEAFMIAGIGDALVHLFKAGHTILISSLQLSSDGTPYGEIQKLFPYATHIEVCPAIDPISKRDAYYTEKYAGRSDHKIEVGGAEMYRPRDFKGFFEVIS